MTIVIYIYQRNACLSQKIYVFQQTKGIGKATAELLVREGARVLIADIGTPPPPHKTKCERPSFLSFLALGQHMPWLLWQLFSLSLSIVNFDLGEQQGEAFAQQLNESHNPGPQPVARFVKCDVTNHQGKTILFSMFWMQCTHRLWSVLFYA